MERKFVSIYEYLASYPSGWAKAITLAVADDGTAWERVDGREWVQITPLPPVESTPTPGATPEETDRE